ncbi:hypothetical protein ACE103_10305 [Bradyrhizobium sp. ma5]|uniref:hypothetical protein n=1 Tax=Bradyrhizobium sp. ma5 TaxID=3344828 RepID=UPI0035D49B69
MFEMTGHGETYPAAGTVAGTAVQSKCFRKPIKINRPWLEQVPIDPTEARELLCSVSPHISVGDRIISQHDGCDGATAEGTAAATDAIETTRPLGDIALPLLARRTSDVVRIVRKDA